MFTVCWLLAVVAGAGAGLVSASPPRPAQPVGAVGDGGDDERGEQVLELVAGQRDEAQRWWVAGVLGGCGHHQERGRQQGQGHLAVPGAPAAGPGADPGRTAPCRPALLEVPGLIDHQHRAGSPRCSTTKARTSSRIPSWSQTAPASRCCMPSGWPGRRAQRSSSSSCGADRPAAPARTPWRAAWAPPWETGPRPGLSPRRTTPATGQGQPLGCGQRPPSDLRLSTQHRIINSGRLVRSALTSQVTNSGWSTRLPAGCRRQ